jgi:hypothetical protein
MLWLTALFAFERLVRAVICAYGEKTVSQGRFEGACATFAARRPAPKWDGYNFRKNCAAFASNTTTGANRLFSGAL